MNHSSFFYNLLFTAYASPDSATLHHLLYYFVIAGLFVLLSVMGCLTYFIWKYRASKSDNEGEPPQIHGDKKVEISLTLFAAALVGVFFYLTVASMRKINQPVGKHQPDLVVTGHQWWWEANYPKAGFTTANEIHVPTGKRILIKFKTADVIHDWWVPALGRKIDIIPGSPNHLWLTVKKPGFYRGQCSEFCGIQHAWMQIQVYAQKPAAFKKWERLHSQPARLAEADSMALLGKKLFTKKTCGNCHTIRGTNNKGDVGPDLTHVASRNTLLTGEIKNTPGNMYRWINDPQKIKEGAHMPKFVLKKKQVGALVSYLEGLR